MARRWRIEYHGNPHPVINRGNCRSELVGRVAEADETERAVLMNQISVVSRRANRDVGQPVGREPEPRGAGIVQRLSSFGETGRKPTNNGQALSARLANTL